MSILRIFGGVLLASPLLALLVFAYLDGSLIAAIEGLAGAVVILLLAVAGAWLVTAP